MRKRSDVIETGARASMRLTRRRPGALSELPWVAAALVAVVSLTACAGGARLDSDSSSQVGAGEFRIRIENFKSSEVTAVQSALNRACHNGAQPIKKSPDLAELRFRPCGDMTGAEVDEVINQALQDLGLADQASVSLDKNTFTVEKTSSGMSKRIACEEPSNSADLYIGRGIAYAKRDEDIPSATRQATDAALARLAEQINSTLRIKTETRLKRIPGGITEEEYRSLEQRTSEARLKGNKIYPPAFGRGGQVCVLATIERAKTDAEIDSDVDDFFNIR